MKTIIKKVALSTILLATVQNAWTCTEDGKEGIIEDNTQYIPADSKSMLQSNIDEPMFHKIIDDVTSIYNPIFENDFNATLKVERNWEDGTVNAYAHRRGGSWNIAMFGGLARHETITPDGFALVVCHEIGHHIGGAPKKGGWFSSWATNEGQADYFATLKCLRKYFKKMNDTEEVLAKLEVPQAVVDACSREFASKEEQMICQRGSMAGLSTAKLFQALRNQETAPRFTTPDENIVSRTDHDHPQTQCRLDTYYQGAICGVHETAAVSQRDADEGVCSRSNGDGTGLRPLCWYKPGR